MYASSTDWKFILKDGGCQGDCAFAMDVWVGIGKMALILIS